MNADTHPCAVDGCHVKILHGMLMCKRHWRRVPTGLKAEVNDSYRGLRRAKSDAACLDHVDRYRVSSRAAITAVEALEAAS